MSRGRNELRRRCAPSALIVASRAARYLRPLTAARRRVGSPGWKWRAEPRYPRLSVTAEVCPRKPKLSIECCSTKDHLTRTPIRGHRESRLVVRATPPRTSDVWVLRQQRAQGKYRRYVRFEPVEGNSLTVRRDRRSKIADRFHRSERARRWTARRRSELAFVQTVDGHHEQARRILWRAPVGETRNFPSGDQLKPVPNQSHLVAPSVASQS